MASSVSLGLTGAAGETDQDPTRQRPPRGRTRPCKPDSGRQPCPSPRLYLIAQASAAISAGSAQGHERRPLQSTAARQLPLCFVRDRDGAAVQYVAKGPFPDSCTVANGLIIQ